MIEQIKNGESQLDFPKQIVDETDPANVYIGVTMGLNASSDAKWMIKLINTTGSTTTISYADGERSFNKIWDNRLLYTY